MSRTLVSRIVVSLTTLAGTVAPADAQLVVASYYSGAIQQYDLNGTAQSGGISGTVIGPGGMTVGPDGKLYVTSQSAFFTGGAFSDAIYRYENGAFAPVITLPPVGLGVNYNPAGIAFSEATNGGVGPATYDLYVARNIGFSDTQFRGALDRFSVTTAGGSVAIGGTPTTLATGLNQPTGVRREGNTILVSEFGNIYGGGTDTGDVRSYSITAGGAPSVLVPTLSGGLTGPGGAVTGPDGNLYVADLLAGAIRKYRKNANGTTTPLGDFANNEYTQQQFPSDLLFTNGYLYVANLGPDAASSGNVTRFSYTTNAVDGSLDFASAQVIITGVSASQLALVPVVPEPATVLGLAAAGLGLRQVLRRRKTAAVRP